MAKFLVLFSTKEGQTEKIASTLATHLRQLGHRVTLRDVKEMAPEVDVAGFDGIIIGGPVHLRKFPRELR